ncbi:hypothetical protein WA588_003673, partial [Blastocystis sp. NMH]
MLTQEKLIQDLSKNAYDAIQSDVTTCVNRILHGEEDCSSLGPFSEVCLSQTEKSRSREMQSVFENVFRSLDASGSGEKTRSVFVYFMELLIALFPQDTKIPEFVIPLYLKDSCSDRAWVDEKKYRPFVTRIIKLIRSVLTPPNHFGYSEEEFASLCQQAVAFMRPLLSAPPATIREGVVMTSCTLSVIPSFQSLVAPFIRSWLDVPSLQKYTVMLLERIFQSISDYHDRTGSLAPDHSAALETVLRTTVDRQSLYMTKLNALLETRAALLPVFLAPALRFRVTPLVQRCLGAMTELTEPARRALAELTRRTMAEVAAAAAATDFDAERASSYETLLVTVVGSAGFLLTVLNASFFAFGEVVLAEVAAVCEGSYEAVCDAICKESCDETCEGTCKEIYKETCKEIYKETCKEICKETCKEICKEISKETSKDTCKNTCKNTCKETTDERTTLARLLLLLHLVFG